MPSKNEIAASLTRAEAIRAGVVDAGAAQTAVSNMSRKNSGFTRKLLPPNLPVEPRKYVYSLSVYGETRDLGPGFPKFRIHAIDCKCETCEEVSLVEERMERGYGEPCLVDLMYFYEEVKVDVTEHTPFTSQQIADAIMCHGPGNNPNLDKRKIGWFVSDHNPPKPQEMKSAEAIYRTECTRLFQEGNAFQAAGKLLEINETHRRAASYLGQKVDWDKPQHKMMDCPGCQEKVREGMVWHAYPQGCGYIFDKKRYEENFAKPQNLKQ